MFATELVDYRQEPGRFLQNKEKSRTAGKPIMLLRKLTVEAKHIFWEFLVEFYLEVALNEKGSSGLKPCWGIIALV